MVDICNEVWRTGWYAIFLCNSLSSTLINYIINWIVSLALQDYPGVQVGTNVHVSDLAYADDIVIKDLLLPTPPRT